MPLIDFFRTLGGRQQPAGLLGQEEQPRPDMFSRMTGGLSRFNENHPGFVFGAGQMIQGNDLTPAFTYAAGVKKSKREQQAQAQKDTATRKFLMRQGYSPDEADEIISSGQAAAFIKPPKEGNNYINAGDGNLFNETTGQWISAPKSAPSGKFRFDGKSVEAQALNGLLDSGQLTEDQAMQLAAGKTITGPNNEIIFMTPQGVFSRQGGDGQPAGGPQGAASDNMIPITEPKVTLDERKAMTFADRLATSGSIIDGLEQVGTSAGERVKSSVPLVGNMLVSQDFQKLDQARRDFINAQLRRESGAVISPEEFDNANRQYFPQPGDGPEVLAQKRRNRQVAIEGMARDSGPTYRGRLPEGVTEDDIAFTMKKHGLTREQVLEQMRNAP